jgi:hypothetical protein
LIDPADLDWLVTHLDDIAFEHFPHLSDGIAVGVGFVIVQSNHPHRSAQRTAAPS